MYAEFACRALLGAAHTPYYSDAPCGQHMMYAVGDPAELAEGTYAQAGRWMWWAVFWSLVLSAAWFPYGEKGSESSASGSDDPRYMV